MSESGEFVVLPSGERAFIPAPVPELELSDRAQELLREAKQLLEALDQLPEPPHHTLVLSLYLRKELRIRLHGQLISKESHSSIYAEEVSREDLAPFESVYDLFSAMETPRIANYLKALAHGVETLKGRPLNRALIKELHQILSRGLLEDSKTPGEFRQRRVLLVGQEFGTPYICFPPPPAESVDAHMAELEQSFLSTDEEPLVQAALWHYQFETIHPFNDFNGRTGRLLIPLFLHHRGALKRPLLYLDYYFKCMAPEYDDKLLLVRESGDYMQWIEFFLEGVIWTAQSVYTRCQAVCTLKKQLATRLESRVSPNLLNHLFDRPVTSVEEMHALDLPDLSPQITHLQQQQILIEVPHRTKGRALAFEEFFSLFSHIEDQPVRKTLS